MQEWVCHKGCATGPGGKQSRRGQLHAPHLHQKNEQLQRVQEREGSRPMLDGQGGRNAGTTWQALQGQGRQSDHDWCAHLFLWRFSCSEIWSAAHVSDCAAEGCGWRQQRGSGELCQGRRCSSAD